MTCLMSLKFVHFCLGHGQGWRITASFTSISHNERHSHSHCFTLFKDIITCYDFKSSAAQPTFYCLLFPILVNYESSIRFGIGHSRCCSSGSHGFHSACFHLHFRLTCHMVLHTVGVCNCSERSSTAYIHIIRLKRTPGSIGIIRPPFGLHWSLHILVLKETVHLPQHVILSEIAVL